MLHRRNVCRLPLLLAAVGLAVTSQGAPRPSSKAAPRLEPVAETRLLMEAINLSNFHGLERLLKQRPADADAWTFARGQALLIAENGNLLMLRPPRGGGQDAWMNGCQELRDAATAVARAAGSRDYERSRAALDDLAGACNRCHQSFRVATRIVPFGDAPAPKPSPDGR